MYRYIALDTVHMYVHTNNFDSNLYIAAAKVLFTLIHTTVTT